MLTKLPNILGSSFGRLPRPAFPRLTRPISPTNATLARRKSFIERVWSTGPYSVAGYRELLNSTLTGVDLNEICIFYQYVVCERHGSSQPTRSEKRRVGLVADGNKFVA